MRIHLHAMMGLGRRDPPVAMVLSRRERGLLSSAVLVGVLAACAHTAPPPASVLSPADQEVLSKIAHHPSEGKYWDEAQRIQNRAAALQVLVAALHDPATVNVPTNYMQAGSGHVALLETIACIFEDDAAPILVEASKDPDARLRMTAMRDLGWKVKHATPATRQAIRDALADPDHDVVIAALDALSSQPDIDAGPKALDILRHPLIRDQRDRNDGYREALTALAAVPYAPALDDLFQIARHPLAEYREKAAAAIGSCASSADPNAKRRALEALKPMIVDPNRDVCVAAAIALAHMHDGSGIPVIAFELRRIVALPKEQWHRSYNLLPMVEALETATGEDFDSRAKKDQWYIYAGNDNFARNLAASSASVQDIMARLAVRGERRAGGTDAEYQQRRGGNFDGQSHGGPLPKLSRHRISRTAQYHFSAAHRLRQIGPVLA